MRIYSRRFYCKQAWDSPGPPKSPRAPCRVLPTAGDLQIGSGMLDARGLGRFFKLGIQYSHSHKVTIDP